MPRLPRPAGFWRDFLAWYARDACYWYFPKGRSVQSSQIIDAFKVLKGLEGRNWSEAQGAYLRGLERKGLYRRRAQDQSDKDAMAMARVWKVVFSTLGLAWIEEKDKISITPAGELLLAEGDLSKTVERQMQRYQLRNPGMRHAAVENLKIRPHIFLLETMLRCGSFITSEEYVLFVSRARSHEEIRYVSKAILAWRALGGAGKEKVYQAASDAHRLEKRRSTLVRTIELNRNSYAMSYLGFAGYLEMPGDSEAAIRIRKGHKRIVQGIVKRFSKAVFIEFDDAKDWFSYYGDPERFPSPDEAADYYIDTGQTETLERTQANRAIIEFQIQEKQLEDYLEQHIEELEPGLALVKRQFATVAGRIDLLCRDRRGDFVVVELKKGRAADKVMGQILRYIGFVRRDMLTRRSQKVRGIIVCRKIDKNLDMAIAGLGSSLVTARTFRPAIRFDRD